MDASARPPARLSACRSAGQTDLRSFIAMACAMASTQKWNSMSPLPAWLSINLGLLAEGKEETQ